MVILAGLEVAIGAAAAISKIATCIVAFADSLPVILVLGTSILLEVAATTFMKLAASKSPLWLVCVRRPRLCSDWW